MPKFGDEVGYYFLCGALFRVLPAFDSYGPDAFAGTLQIRRRAST